MSDDIDSTEPSEALCVTLTRLRDALSKVSGTWAIKAQLDKCIRALQVEGAAGCTGSVGGPRQRSRAASVRLCRTRSSRCRRCAPILR